MSNARRRVLFVCVENAGRSQMAEAFARMHGGDSIEPYSAGSRPSGTINPQAVSVMRDLGYDLTAHKSKSLNDLPGVEYEAVVTMGCGDECPFVRAKRHFNWDIPDPKGRDIDGVREIRDLISSDVRELLQALNLNDDSK